MTEYIYWVLESALLVLSLGSRRWAVMVLAFSLPFSRRLPSFPFPLLNYQNLIFLFAIIAYIAHPREKDSAGGKVRFAVPLTMLALFFTASFINTLTTFQVPRLFGRLWDPYNNVMNYKALMTCLAIYFLGSMAVKSRDDLIAVLTAGMAGIFVESGYTAFEYVVWRPGRVTGHLGEPNSMGSFLACGFVLAFAIVLIMPWRSLLWRISLATCIVAPIGLVGTLSRGSYVSAALGAALLATLINRKVLVAGVVVLALSPLWAPQAVRDRFMMTFHAEDQENWRFKDGRGAEGSAVLAMIDERLDEQAAEGEIDANETRLDSSIATRLVVWEAAIRMMGDYPLGLGFGVFPWYLQYYSSVVRWKATHNIYLRVGTEAGIPALILFLGLLAAFLWSLIRIGRGSADPLARAFGYGMMAYLLTLMFNAMTIDLFFQIDVNGQFWILLGAVLQAPLVLAGAPEAPAAAPEVAGPPGPRPLYELVR
ncbi:MAG: O-antigen ligase family protein [Acidobacteria bacterium]|nr:O-antigen ligase family protein [Acidobacteriota bacterium]